jgi:hypothetical protein
MSKLDNPAGAAQKWATKMGQATQAYVDGVNGVAVAPGVAAARASTKWLNKLNENKAKFERNVSAVSLTEWQTAARDKGAQRLAGGATAALPKMEAFTASFFAYLKSGKAQIDAMPTDTLDQALAKANAQARYNAGYTGYR